MAALEIAARESFDAALIDLHMPGMDGVAVCRALRERAIAMGRDVPVFIMTAAYLPVAATKVVEAGAVALLKKPFDYDKFITTLERFCGGELPIPVLSVASTSTSEKKD